MRTLFPRLRSLLLLLTLLTGCGQALPTPEVPQASASQAQQAVYTTPVTPSTKASLEKETELLPTTPAAPLEGPKTVASGTLVKKNGKAVIDYSNTKDGYVMVQYTAQTSKPLKAQVKGPTTYKYNLKQGQWTIFPLSDGNGSYQVSVFQNVSGTRYTNELSQSFKVELTDEFAPFLRPNQYVDYSNAVNTLAKAKDLTKGHHLSPEAGGRHLRLCCQKPQLRLSKGLHGQKRLSAGPGHGAGREKGICFDYAALMAGMVRSLGIPCKLVVGYAGSAYHAWISIWTEESGWVDNVIFFNGTSWQRMEPTFASSGKQSASIMAYIGDGKNYTTKYLY